MVLLATTFDSPIATTSFDETSAVTAIALAPQASSRSSASSRKSRRTVRPAGPSSSAPAVPPIPTRTSSIAPPILKPFLLQASASLHSASPERVDRPQRRQPPLHHTDTSSTITVRPTTMSHNMYDSTASTSSGSDNDDDRSLSRGQLRLRRRRERTAFQSVVPVPSSNNVSSKAAPRTKTSRVVQEREHDWSQRRVTASSAEQQQERQKHAAAAFVTGMGAVGSTREGVPMVKPGTSSTASSSRKGKGPAPASAPPVTPSHKKGGLPSSKAHAGLGFEVMGLDWADDQQIEIGVDGTFSASRVLFTTLALRLTLRHNPLFAESAPVQQHATYTSDLGSGISSPSTSSHDGGSPVLAHTASPTLPRLKSFTTTSDEVVQLSGLEDELSPRPHFVADQVESHDHTSPYPIVELQPDHIVFPAPPAPRTPSTPGSRRSSTHHNTSSIFSQSPATTHATSHQGTPSPAHAAKIEVRRKSNASSVGSSSRPISKLYFPPPPPKSTARPTAQPSAPVSPPQSVSSAHSSTFSPTVRPSGPFPPPPSHSPYARQRSTSIESSLRSPSSASGPFPPPPPHSPHARHLPSYESNNSIISAFEPIFPSLGAQIGPDGLVHAGTENRRLSKAPWEDEEGDELDWMVNAQRKLVMPDPKRNSVVYDEMTTMVGGGGEEEERREEQEERARFASRGLEFPTIRRTLERGLMSDVVTTSPVKGGMGSMGSPNTRFSMCSDRSGQSEYVDAFEDAGASPRLSISVDDINDNTPLALLPPNLSSPQLDMVKQQTSLWVLDTIASVAINDRPQRRMSAIGEEGSDDAESFVVVDSTPSTTQPLVAAAVDPSTPTTPTPDTPLSRKSSTSTFPKRSKPDLFLNPFPTFDSTTSRTSLSVPSPSLTSYAPFSPTFASTTGAPRTGAMYSHSNTSSLSTRSHGAPSVTATSYSHTSSFQQRPKSFLGRKFNSFFSSSSTPSSIASPTLPMFPTGGIGSHDIAILSEQSASEGRTSEETDESSLMTGLKRSESIVELESMLERFQREERERIRAIAMRGGAGVGQVKELVAVV